MRKESILKATGHALRVDPDSIEVTAPDTRAALVAWHSAEPPSVPVWMFDLECSHELVAVATVLSKMRPNLVSPATPEA